MANTLIIAGTPGVGKSTVAEILAERLNGLHLDLSKLVTSKKLYAFFDEERGSYVIDENRVVEEVKRIVDSGVYEIIVIDTHYPEILPGEIVDKVFILRLDPRILEERLRSKGWSWRKIRENVLAEILSVVTTYAVERFGYEKIYEIDVTGKNLEEIVNTILEIIKDSGNHRPGPSVDWLSSLPLEVILRYEREENTL